MGVPGWLRRARQRQHRTEKEGAPDHPTDRKVHFQSIDRRRRGWPAPEQVLHNRSGHSQPSLTRPRKKIPFLSQLTDRHANARAANCTDKDFAVLSPPRPVLPHHTPHLHDAHDVEKMSKLEDGTLSTRSISPGGDADAAELARMGYKQELKYVDSGYTLCRDADSLSVGESSVCCRCVEFLAIHSDAQTERARRTLACRSPSSVLSPVFPRFSCTVSCVTLSSASPSPNPYVSLEYRWSSRHGLGLVRRVYVLDHHSQLSSLI